MKLLNMTQSELKYSDMEELAIKVRDAILDYAITGQKINAIKLFRDTCKVDGVCCMSLMESKNVVDTMMEKHMAATEITDLAAEARALQHRLAEAIARRGRDAVSAKVPSQLF